MLNIHKFCKKEILIQPPGEPRKPYLGDIPLKSLSYTKFQKSPSIIDNLSFPGYTDLMPKTYKSKANKKLYKSCFKNKFLLFHAVLFYDF